MIGEFDYTDMFFAHKYEEGKELKLYFPYSSYFVFITFLILMPIIVMNLLTALAVDDVNNLREKAHLEVQRLRIELTLDLNVYDKMKRIKRIVERIHDFYGNTRRRILHCVRRFRHRSSGISRTNHENKTLISNDDNKNKSKDYLSINEAIYLYESKSVNDKNHLIPERYKTVKIPEIKLFSSWAVECKNVKSEPWWNHYILIGLRTIIGKRLSESEMDESSNKEFLEGAYSFRQKDFEQITKVEFENLENRLSKMEVKLDDLKIELNESCNAIADNVEKYKRSNMVLYREVTDSMKKLTEKIDNLTRRE